MKPISRSASSPRSSISTAARSSGRDPPAGDLAAVELLGQVGMAAVGRGPGQDGRVERQVLEGVQRVVVHEDGDRPLRRQQVGRVLDQPADVVRHPGRVAVRTVLGPGGRGVLHGKGGPGTGGSDGSPGVVARRARGGRKGPRTSLWATVPGLPASRGRPPSASTCLSQHARNSHHGPGHYSTAPGGPSMPVAVQAGRWAHRPSMGLVSRPRFGGGPTRLIMRRNLPVRGSASSRGTTSRATSSTPW